MNQIKTVGIVGAGTMGNGIAQVFASCGYTVILHDIDEQSCAKGLKTIEKSLDKFVQKAKLDEAGRNQILSHISTSTNIDDLSNSDFIIEAATENQKLKQEIFTQLDRIAKQDTILATNTSSIPITCLAAVTSRPEKVIGMHFMNPVPLMKGVEVIRAQQTSDETNTSILSLVETLKKSFVRSADKAGFVANRILMPMIREAILTLEEGVSEKEDIDRCMTDCCNFPMGPLMLADLIGLDTCAAILNVMAEGLENERYRPPASLNKLVAAGHLGRKTGRGFYEY